MSTFVFSHRLYTDQSQSFANLICQTTCVSLAGPISHYALPLRIHLLSYLRKRRRRERPEQTLALQEPVHLPGRARPCILELASGALHELSALDLTAQPLLKPFRPLVGETASAPWRVWLHCEEQVGTRRCPYVRCYVLIWKREAQKQANPSRP